jgi:HSP20 family protein
MSAFLKIKAISLQAPQYGVLCHLTSLEEELFSNTGLPNRFTQSGGLTMDLLGAMVNRDAFRELEGMSDRLNRLLNGRATPAGGRDESMAVVEWTPIVDVLETDAEFQIRAELPGVDKNDVKLFVADGLLTISGHREQEKDEKGKRYHRRERVHGSFARSFTLPDSVDEQKVGAEFRNGVLTVRLPKSEKAKPKSIEITVT